MTRVVDTLSSAIVVQNLYKRYGTTVALDGLTFSIPAGALTGFLGPNGAGKTTTFRSLLGLTRPQAGTIEVLGMSVGAQTSQIVKRLGAVVEEPGLVKGLNGRDNMRVAASTLGRGQERIDELLEFVGLADAAHRKIDGYSKGMRQRLALAAALLGDPELLLLDEPLDGLDPAGQAQIKQKLRDLAMTGKTVVVSSHNLPDVESLVDRVVVINRGKLIASGTLAELLSSRQGGFRVMVDDPTRAVAVLGAAGLSAHPLADGVLVETNDGRLISRVLAGADLFPGELVRQGARLEEIFLELTAET